MLSSQQHTFYMETKWFKLQLFMHNFLQKILSEWKPYMAKIVCKS
jgi:hypothetical protein